MKLAADPQLITTLQSGGIAIIPTDTIYGLVGLANNRQTVERIYQTKGRNPDKACIILISQLQDLDLFKVTIDHETNTILTKLWPGEVSVILPCPHEAFAYLHRGTNNLAFRLPAAPDLQKLLATTGPLVAPSANPEGRPPATSITEAYTYFGPEIDYYVNTDETLIGEPSTLVAIKAGRVMIHRQGKVIIPNNLLS